VLAAIGQPMAKADHHRITKSTKTLRLESLPDPPGKAGAPDGIGENPVFGQGELSVNRKEACAFCQLTGFQGSLMIAATSDQRNGGPS
jgi:hypothetical protein